MPRILSTTALSLALLPAGLAVAAEPSITLSTDRVQHGDYLTVTGRGWDSPDAVDRVLYFGLRGPEGQKIHIGNANNSKRGRWTFTYKVRRYVEPGKWRIVARQHREADDGEIVKLRRSASFVVSRRGRR